jgi:hypothetical protein
MGWVGIAAMEKCSFREKHDFPLTQQETKANMSSLTPRPTRREARAGLFFREVF